MESIFYFILHGISDIYIQNRQGSRTVLCRLHPEFRASWKSHYWVSIHKSHTMKTIDVYVYRKNKDTEFLPRVSPSSTKGMGVIKLVKIFLFFRIFDFNCILNVDRFIKYNQVLNTFSQKIWFRQFKRDFKISYLRLNILNQSYNATVFYFDNISFLEHVLNQLFLPNKNSISQASYRTMVLTICFQLFKKQTILWR